MHQRTFHIVAVLAITGAFGWAQSGLARVSSSQPVKINGITAPSSIPSLPVLPGSTVTTAAAPATVTTSSGAKVTVPPNSQATISGGGSVTGVQSVARPNPPNFPPLGWAPPGPPPPGWAPPSISRWRRQR